VIPFQQALDLILTHAQPPGESESVPLAEALGRTLAVDVTAREDIPISDNSAVDGFAVRRADVAAEALLGRPLQVLEVLGAEHVATRRLQAGQAAKVMTGTPLPPGADCVVMVEHARMADGMVTLGRVPEPGEHVRRAGGDIRRGQVALARGLRLGAAHVGLLASLGHAAARVTRRPRVAVLATGSELVAPGEALAPGRVRNSNGYTLAALAAEAGAEVSDLGLAADDRAALKRTLARALDAHDVVVTSGGVSMGDFDYIKHLTDELGLEVHVRGVNIKPGKPMVFGQRAGALFFGLPGNPVSVVVTFQQFVRPALLARLGRSALGFRTLRAPLAHGFEKHDGKRHFARGILHAAADGALAVRFTGPQDSNLLHSVGLANCFVVIEEARSVVRPGEPVTVQLFDGEPLPGAAPGA
jgi:molybdopterin molybdotransferase